MAKGTLATMSCDMTTNGYVLGLHGEQVSETDGTGHWLHTNVFAQGELLATYSGTDTFFALNDWLGTKRGEYTASTGALTTYASLPFGDNLTSFGPGPDATEQHFTGKERDIESTNDYFGARYYSSNVAAKFLTPDPESPTPLHLLNPQRWNKYSYGLNNPLSFTDSGGRDAAAVNFSKEIVMVGHEGVMSVTSDGTVRYARFGPVGGHRLFGKGQVQSFTLKTKIQFDANGNPTAESLNAVKKELSSSSSSPEQGQDPTSIRLNYFKTTPQETANLNQWIDQQQAASNQGNAPEYVATGQNCADFRLRGLVAGGALTQSQANRASDIPNPLFNQLKDYLFLINLTPPQELQGCTSATDSFGNTTGTHCD